MSYQFLCSLQVVSPSTEFYLPGSLTLIHERLGGDGARGDGTFIPHFILADHLKLCLPAVLITTKQMETHWEEIGNTLGNYSEAKERGLVKVIDLVEGRWKVLEGEEANEMDTSEIFQKVESSLETIASGTDDKDKPSLLIIEDMSPLYMEYGDRASMELLLKLRDLSRTRNCSILTLLPEFGGSRSCFDKIVTDTICSIYIAVVPVRSGASSQVSGNLHIFNKLKMRGGGRTAPMAAALALAARRSFQYKLDEKSVRLISVLS